jgi:hypothetical protein
MRKRKPRKCRICKKSPVWVGGDVKDPGPFCKRCYHKHRSPGRNRRRDEAPVRWDERPPQIDDDPKQDFDMTLEDFGVPFDTHGMPLAWSSDEGYYWACIVAEDEEILDFFGLDIELYLWCMARGMIF